MPNEIPIERIKLLSPKPGDVLVFEIDADCYNLNQHERDSITSQVREICGDVKVMILAPGMRLAGDVQASTIMVSTGYIAPIIGPHQPLTSVSLTPQKVEHKGPPLGVHIFGDAALLTDPAPLVCVDPGSKERPWIMQRSVPPPTCPADPEPDDDVQPDATLPRGGWF